MTDPEGFGWIFVAPGLVLAGVGLIWVFAPSILWLGRLVGHIHIKRENLRFYSLLVMCLLLSIALTLIL